MSENDGTLSPVPQVAGGVRGSEQAQGPNGQVRPGEGQGPVAGHPEAGRGGAHHPVPAGAGPGPGVQRDEQQPGIGFSVTLTRSQVEQAIKARALQFAKSKGVQVPSDETDFSHRAVVRWQEDGAAAVTLKV